MVEDAWANTPHSDSRMNKVTNIVNTGTYLSSLDKTKHGILIATDSTGGLEENHVYLCSADGTQLIDITDVDTHTHYDSSEGGSLERIYAANNGVFDLILTKATDLYEASWASPVYWNKAVTSTGSVENKTDGTTGERSIRLRPNGTSGSGATISYPHLKLDFANTSDLTFKAQIETATSIVIHVGVNCDDVTAADTNTVKYNAEVCTATSSNWFLRTADGTATSASSTGVAISTSRVGITIDHDPTLGTPEVDMYINGGSLFQKTTNIPVTSTSASNNLVKASVKNATAADRPLLFYGAKLSYTVSDNWIT